ncbi:MAG: class I SAM-dependent methyltransferase [Saprospiraceae bacterium]|nr:class I SAM-dependent methyltransferase [Saprospiraceae bacterium]
MEKIMGEIKYLSEAEPVSMADAWFDMATSDHFWMIWRFERLKTMVRQKLIDFSIKKVFEIGCGSGTVLEQVSKNFGVNPDGCDLNDFALKKIKIKDQNIYCYNIYDQESTLENKYDIIILFDVIEHIEEDVNFVNSCLFHLKPGGKCIINVPAYMHLFSKYDKAVGHVRRYSKSMVTEKFSQINGDNLTMQYWGVTLYFLAIARKIMYLFTNKNIVSKGFEPPSKLFNSILSFLAKAENKLLRSPWIGSSLMFVFDKKN